MPRAWTHKFCKVPCLALHLQCCGRSFIIIENVPFSPISTRLLHPQRWVLEHPGIRSKVYLCYPFFFLSMLHPLPCPFPFMAQSPIPPLDNSHNNTENSSLSNFHSSIVPLSETPASYSGHSPRSLPLAPRCTNTEIPSTSKGRPSPLLGVLVHICSSIISHK
jgi:hypothetical protein